MSHKKSTKSEYLIFNESTVELPDLKCGITAPTIEKANLKRDLTQIISKRILVADSSKYGKSQLYEVSPLNAVDIIITDSNLPKVAQEQIKALVVELYLV